MRIIARPLNSIAISVGNLSCLKAMKRKTPTCKTSAMVSDSGRVAVVKPDEYEMQLQKKVDLVKELFSNVKTPELEIFRSPTSHYRQRCEFRVFHEDDDLYYVMYEKDASATCSDSKPKMIRKDSFPAASTLINQLMPILLDLAKKDLVLKRKLYTVAFQTTLTKEAMITLIYHRPIGEEWEESAEKLHRDLSAALGSDVTKLNIIGRSRKQKIVIGNDFVHETFSVNGKNYTYKQVEGCFSQPNGVICASMLSWAQKVSSAVSRSSEEDLLELYCGNCNFTIPLSENFRRVLATEISRPGVDAGRDNLRMNEVSNVLLARMSSSEFVQKWNTGDDLGKRLQHHKSADFTFSTLFVDPPRQGLDLTTIKLLGKFDKVLYISCNPHTLHFNTQSLQESHEICSFALFDQFPYTGHIECGILFTVRNQI